MPPLFRTVEYLNICALIQELDDDGDFTIYSDIDDPNDGMAFVSDSTNPHSLPLSKLSSVKYLLAKICCRIQFC